MSFVLNKTFILLGLVCSSSILVACGGEGNGSNNQKTPVLDNSNNGNSNEFVFEFFDARYDDSVKAEGIKRVTWNFTDGDAKVTQTNIVNNNNRKGIKNNELIVLGNKFEGTYSTKNIDVEDNKVIFNMPSNNGSQTEQTITEFQSIDISGVSGSKGNKENSTGLITDLTLFNKIPDTVQFPKGSVCYIPKITNSFSHYRIDMEDKTNYSSIDSWIKFRQDTPNRTTPLIRTESSKVGDNNQYDAARAIYYTDLENEYKNYSAVNYKGTIFDTEYYSKGSHSPNMDISKGAVRCTTVNKVAADFLQDQIIQYYK